MNIFPTEHFLSEHLKIKILIIFSLLLNLNIYGQNAQLGGSIGYSQTICPGEIPQTFVNLSPASGGGTSPIEYLWMYTTNPSLPVSNWNIAPDINNQESYSPAATYITTYFIRCARREGFANYSAESNIVNIAVSPNPTAHINENPGIISAGTPFGFSAATSSNSTYSWDFNEDGIIDCNTQSCSYTFPNSGTFSILLTVNNGTCTWTDIVTITVIPSVNSIPNPCDCDNPQNFSTGGDYFIQDFILINGAPNESWQITAINSGAIYDNTGTALPIGTDISEITNSPGEFYLNFWFKSGDGYNLELSNGNDNLNTGTSDPCNCFSPLPVELVSFDAILDANEKEVTLKWSTATETNNSHFEVQRSLDGSRFDFFEVVAGNGNSTLSQSYAIVDKNPVPGVNYYRLKQVDFNGTQTYSYIVSAKISTESIISSVIPNPIRDIAIVRFGEKPPVWSKLEILSSTGQVMATYQVEDILSQEINMNRFEKGIYFLRIKNAERKEKAFFKIVKF